MKVSIVIPVYNSVNSLVKLTKQVDIVFNETPYEYEIIFVDDASPNPKTWETLNEINKNNSNISCFSLMRNFGQQAATICGLANSTSDYVVTMDDDFQHNPNDILKLLEKKQHDIVIAKFEEKKHTFFKRITSLIKGYFDYLILGKPKNIQLSSFRLFKKKVVDNMLKINSPYPFIPAMMLSISKDIAQVTVSHSKREEGSSGYSVIGLIKLFSHLIINNSSILLRFTGLIGIISSAISFFIGIYILIKKLTIGIEIDGWTSLIIAITFSSGLILFTLGVIGEYLVRIIATIDNKPVYVVRHHLKIKTEKI